MIPSHLYLRRCLLCLQVELPSHSLQSSLPPYHMGVQAFRLRFVLQGHVVRFRLLHQYMLLLHFLHSLFDNDRLLLSLLLNCMFLLHLQAYRLQAHSLANLRLSLLMLYMQVQVFQFRLILHPGQGLLLLLHLYALLLHLQHLHAYICILQAHFRFRKFRICLQAQL